MWRAGRASNIVAIGLWLTACSAPPEAAKTPDSAKDTVFRESVETMDKARAVEDTAAQHQRQLEQAEQQAEGR